MGKKTRICLNCSADITGRHKLAKFCTVSCANENWKKNNGNNEMRLEIQQNKENILKRKKRQCYFCQTNQKLQLHHISYYNNSLENLIVLCAKCHKRLHNYLRLSIAIELAYNEDALPVLEKYLHNKKKK